MTKKCWDCYYTVSNIGTWSSIFISKEFYVSKNHCIKVLDYFVPAYNLKGLKQVKKDSKYIEYYHIVTDNKFGDSIIANGVACESFMNIKKLSKEDKIKLNSLINKKFDIRLIEGKKENIKSILPYLKKSTRKYLKN